jgi:hypothetical protein
MRRPRFRRLARVAAVASITVVFFYVLGGHALHAQANAMEPMHEVGICLLLATTVAGGMLLLKRRLRPLPPPRARPHPPLVALAPAALLQPRYDVARGSPAWLQRFLR